MLCAAGDALLDARATLTEATRLTTTQPTGPLAAQATRRAAADARQAALLLIRASYLLDRTATTAKETPCPAPAP